MKYASISLLGGLAALAIAQSPDPLAPRPNGMSPAAPASYMLWGGTVHVSPTKTISADNAPMIVIENGRIARISENTQFARIDTRGYQIIEIDPGAHVYAGFIDPYVQVRTPDLPDSATGTHWSSRVTPQNDALRVGLGADAAESLREMGFTTAMIAPDSGIFRGYSAIVSTAADFDDDSMGDPPVYKAHAGQMMGFDRGGWGDRAYPTSHMGVVALMRQTFADAQSRHQSGDHADASCLDAIDPATTTLFYDTDHELEALLADNVAQEFGHQNLVIVDNGTAHRRLDAFKAMGHPVIVPLRFAETPDVFSVGAADSVDLATLQHWERAPANARWLHNSGLDVALTTSKLRSGEKFWDNLRDAIAKGLPAEDALAMITTNPAKLLGLDDQGEIAKDNIANLVIASADMLDPDAKAKVLSTWIDGRPHHISDAKNTRFDGDWSITVVGAPFTMTMSIDGTTIEATDPGDGTDNDPPYTGKARKVSIDQNQISFLLDDEDDGSGTYVMTGALTPSGIIRGTALAPDQTSFQWTAARSPKAITMDDFAGTWRATLAEKFNLDFKIGKDDITIIERIENGDDIEQTASEHTLADALLTFAFEHTPFGMPGVFTIALTPPSDNDAITGSGTRPDGKAFTVRATRLADSDEPSEDKATLPDLPDAPFGPYTYQQPPSQNSYLLGGATVWTQGERGIIEDGWVLITDGKVSAVGGRERPAPRVREENYINAAGMHITPGLIDAHSHTGLFRFGVNESGQAVTAECRISDSLDPAHPGFYRELAGGLTTANLLHGSANPIGGQSKTIKLRWDSDKPSDMFFEGAKPGIKFALGENVKQSNWGDDFTSRYPQTRLGVETLMRDRFIRAREYADRGMKTEPGHRDIELETLAQILAGERLIHCHSYRQDEILMLCRIAEEFGFKIGTFQHGLETYKVAEIVKQHAIGASIFSDWWAYKAEVVDAIPFAGPINHEVGLLTSFNSDSDDVARRMNVEAGKALKYAKLSGIEMTEQDALNFVTLNPAKQLMIDDRVGSLEPGKDADVVVWTGDPLSSLSRPEMTFVDGRLYFSRELDASLRARNDSERQRLIQMILTEGKKPRKDKDNVDDETNAPKGELVDSDDPQDPDHHHHSHAYADHHANTERGDCGCSQLLPAFNTDY